MAYQNVGTPRFYVNMIEWMSETGYQPIAHEKFRTLPVSTATGFKDAWTNVAGTFNNQSFMALLGHDLPSQEAYISLSYADEPQDAASGAASYAVGLYPQRGQDKGINVNMGVSSYAGWNFYQPQYNGFSIATFNGEGHNYYEPAIWGLVNGVLIKTEVPMGSVVLGSYFTMPHSSDLNLTMSREYGGIKTIETRGGASLSNAFYTKPPMWGTAAPWELYSGTPTNQALSRGGRRIWDLSFSYLQDSDVFPMLSTQASYESTSAAGDVYSVNNTTWHNSNTLLDSDNFYSQVIHKTNGGQLPFIFQPDNSNNNPDQFCIAKFDMNSFKFEQVANGVYNVKLKIREVW